MGTPRILLFDIETSPIHALVWNVWNVNIRPEQITKDWEVLSWAAMWLDTGKIEQEDRGPSKKLSEEDILERMWELLNEADIVVTQNGTKFDVRRLNTRFLFFKMKPPSPFKHTDTYKIAKARFGFTFNSLEHMAKYLGLKLQKMVDRKFKGMDLWKACEAGNKKAWAEMAAYNKQDVLVTKELYERLRPWDVGTNIGVYREVPTCTCGSTEFIKRGFYYLAAGKHQRYTCKGCGRWTYTTGRSTMHKGAK